MHICLTKNVYPGYRRNSQESIRKDSNPEGTWGGDHNKQFVEEQMGRNCCSHEPSAVFPVLWTSIWPQGTCLEFSWELHMRAC